MRYHLVSAPALSGSTAAHMPAICVLFAADHPLAATPSRTITILGEQLGSADQKSRKKKTSSPTKWIAQYQGSIWEILPVAHDGVPFGRGAFITAISFLQRGRPSDSCMPPSVPDQPEQLQLQKSLNRAMGLQGSQSHCQVFTTSRARKTR